MNQQKGFAKIALMVLVIVVIGAVGYFAFMREKAPEVATDKHPTPTQNEMPNTDQNTGTKITYSGQWTQAQFPQNEYHHSVNIMLPTTWEFNCCGDTDSFSAHSIYPRSSATNPETSPRIIVYDFVLSGCPDGEYASCSIDQLQRVTPNQYMTSLTNHLNKSGEVAGLESLNKTGTTKLSDFTTNVIVYGGVSRSNQSADLYLIQSSKGVVGVVFQQPQSFDSNLKTEFLNRITAN